MLLSACRVATSVANAAVGATGCQPGYYHPHGKLSNNDHVCFAACNASHSIPPLSFAGRVFGKRIETVVAWMNSMADVKRYLDSKLT